MRITRLHPPAAPASAASWLRACFAMCEEVPLAQADVRHAYPIPWRVVERDASGLLTIVNESDCVLSSVRVSAVGAGVLGLSLPVRVAPGGMVTVRVRGVLDEEGEPLDPGAQVLVRWFHPDRTELVWPIAW